MDTKRFILLISALTAAVCVLTIVYNFASMPPYGEGTASAVPLYENGNAPSMSGPLSPSGTVESAVPPPSAEISPASSKKPSCRKSSAARPAASRRPPSGKAAPAGPVNLNTATVEQLEAVPYIGPTRAQAIIDYRNAHGAFKSISDLDGVKGFGAKMIEKVRPYLTLG